MITMYVIASAIQSRGGAQGIANASHHNPVLVSHVPLKYSAEVGIVNIFVIK